MAAEPTAPPPLLQRFPVLERLRLARRRKVPLVQQTTASDCGAACLAMVLGYFGKRLQLDDIRAATGFGREGVDALRLLKGGRWFGLRGRGLKIQNLDDLKFLAPASILHWDFNHFVVFERWTPKGLHVVDPAFGRRFVDLAALQRSFTGVALSFEPSEQFERGGDSASPVWGYLRQVLSQQGLFSRILITSALVQLFALAVPVLTGLVVDRVVPRADYHLLLVVAVGLLAVSVFNFLTSIVRSYLLLQFRTQLDAQMTLDFLDHLVDLPYAFFQQRSTGDLLMRLSSNTTIREILTSSALSGVLDGFLVCFYLVLLFIGSFKMGLLVLGLGLLRVALFLATRHRQRHLMAQSLQVQAKSQSYQVQMLAGIETLKASGTEHRSVEGWANLFVDVLNVSLQRGRLTALVDAAMAGLGMLSTLAILAFGTLQVMAGELSLGLMLGLSALAGGFLVPLSQLISTAFQLQLLGTYLERMNDVLDTPREQQREKFSAAAKFRGAITLEKVSFRYSPFAPLVVKDVSVEITPGSFVALVGRTGSGKSTLASLLVGLYVPTSGRILFDGANLSDLDLRSVRNQVGVVPQHPYLFGASIRSNITLIDPTLSLARVIEAAKRAQIDEDIRAMPMGYDTILADGGASLSGGQRQRLALARALVHRPSILFLDEATSSLDAITERKIQRELAALHCTRIVIAHRLSTIQDADLILVMEDGSVVERGNHEDLMTRGGLYAGLVNSQIRSERALEATDKSTRLSSR